MPKTVLFDLDGTLLPMDQDEFVTYYFRLLAKKMAPYGYEPKKLISSVWGGTEAMVKNDGSRTNEEAFWSFFVGEYGEEARGHMPVFEEFYAREFQEARVVCGCNPKAAETVRLVQRLSGKPVLATNPLFPPVATHSRIRWAGLEPEDFRLVTTYDSCTTCKPNVAYYQEIVDRLSLDPRDCLMVGNDVGEDMVAERLGMKVFLLTDCLIDRKEQGIEGWPHGDFDELMEFLKDFLA